MNKFLFSLIVLTFYFDSSLKQETFKILDVIDKETKIIFDIPDVNIINNDKYLLVRPKTILFS